MKNLMTKNLVKGLVLAFLTLTVVSCGDDDLPKVKIETISYTPNKTEVKVKKAVSSVVAKKTPANAVVKFAIKAIKKGDQAYTNPTNGFSIDVNSGKIALKENHSVAVGVYKLTVEATDLTSNKKTTNYEVTVK